MLQRSHDTTIDLDLDLARERVAENPVYYVQYAHARIASVLRKAGEARVARALAAREPRSSCTRPSARWSSKLLAFPSEVREAADAPRAAPHRRLRARARPGRSPRSTATARSSAPSREASRTFRLRLCVAAQRTIARALDLLGVHAPDEM